MSIVRTSKGKVFETLGEESILDAALRSNVVLPHSCRTGRCSSCIGKLTQGLTHILQSELGINESQRSDGWILTCARSARTDLHIEIEDLGDFQLTPAKTLPSRIAGIELLASDVVSITLRFPPSVEFHYRAGQSVNVTGRDGLSRSYSIANAPSSSRTITLHVRRVLGGAMSTYWFEQARINDLLRVRGPNGTFFLRDIAMRELVFLATGTGIAPVNAMLAGLAVSGTSFPRSITVYWGGRTRKDFYCELPAAGMTVDFVPVLSREDESWRGARGYVQHALLRSKREWGQVIVFACGSEVMVKEAQAELITAGLPSRHFYSDAFVSSSTITV